MHILVFIPIVATFSSVALGPACIIAAKSQRPLYFASLLFSSTTSFKTSSTLISLGITKTNLDFLLVALIFHGLHMYNVLFIERSEIPEALRGIDATRWTRWRAAYNISANVRWLGTSRQVPGIQYKTTRDLELGNKRSDDNKEPQIYSSWSKIAQLKTSHKPFLNYRYGTMLQCLVQKIQASHRLRFIATRLLIMALIYSLEKGISQLLNPYRSHPSPFALKTSIYDFTPRKTIFLRRIFFPSLYGELPTKHEVGLRIWFAIDFLWADFAALTRLHDTCAIFFVGTGWDKPGEWPGLFGDVRGCWSLRRLWGVFWHKLHYRAYNNLAVIFTRRANRLLLVYVPRTYQRLATRLLNNLTIFTFTALVHIVIGRELGFKSVGFNEFLWWMGMFASMVLEGLIRDIYVSAMGIMGWKRNAILERAVGYLWVFAFLFLSLPKTVFGRLYDVEIERRRYWHWGKAKRLVRRS